MSSITFPTNLLASIDVLRPESSASQEISLIAWEALSHFIDKMQNLSEYIGAICIINGVLGGMVIIAMRKMTTLTGDRNHADAKQKWLWYSLITLVLAAARSFFMSIYAKNYHTSSLSYAKALEGLYPYKGVRSESSCNDLVKFVEATPAFIEKNRFNFGVIGIFAILSASVSLFSLYSKVRDPAIEKEQQRAAKILLITSLFITTTTTFAYYLTLNYTKIKS